MPTRSIQRAISRSRSVSRVPATCSRSATLPIVPRWADDLSEHSSEPPPARAPTRPCPYPRTFLRAQLVLPTPCPPNCLPPSLLPRWSRARVGRSPALAPERWDRSRALGEHGLQDGVGARARSGCLVSADPRPLAQPPRTERRYSCRPLLSRPRKGNLGPTSADLSATVGAASIYPPRHGTSHRAGLMGHLSAAPR